MKIPQISLKAAIAVVLIAGTIAILGLLGSNTVPSDNRDLFNIALGVWLTWGTTAVKRLFDSTEASDIKNSTINAQAQALASQPGSPAP